jgi:hypothetical protein
MAFTKCSAAALAVLAGTTACNTTESKADDAVGVPGMVVTTQDGERFEGTALHISLREGAPFAQAGIAARAKDGSQWSASFAFEPADVRSVTVRLEPRPLEAGNGFVAIMKGSDWIAESDSGSLSYSLQGNRLVEGEAVTVPDDASATFKGEFSISCWVYPETLSQEPNGYGDGTVRIEDVWLTSSFCQQFQDLRR